VGAGIRAAPARKSADGVLDDAWNRGVSELWEAWSKDPSAVDAEGRRTFAEIQRWCVDELVQVGEALVVRCYKARSDGLPGLMLQCVEAEQLDMDLVEWKEGDGPTRQVRGGVEIDEYGRAVAYHLKPETFPGLTIVDRKSIRKPAEDVIHVMEPGRARQTRGTGRFTSVMLKLRDLESFSNMFLGYDLLAQRRVRYAYLYPFGEALAGVLMIAGGAGLWLAVPVAFVIGTIGAISVFKAVYIDRRELRCACVGGDSHVPLGFVSLTEDLMMVAMAVWMGLKYLWPLL